VQRPRALAGDSTLHFLAAGNSANGIQALLSSGFQIGTDLPVNQNTKTYYWMAFRNSRRVVIVQ
jgi:ribulose bisphosphate carboxylase small subunit